MKHLRTLLAFALAVVPVAVACKAPPPAPPPPIVVTFQPTPGNEHLWISTPIAIEIQNERDAREVEANDATYVGELRARVENMPASGVAPLAARLGATHFRLAITGDDRAEVMLYRVDPSRWGWLPAGIRPATPAGPQVAERSSSRAF